MKNLWNNEAGFIISAELVLVLTIAVIGVITGLSHVAMAVNSELSDVGHALGALNQSYQFTGFHCCLHGGKFTSANAGSAFADVGDVCDCDNSDCDLFANYPDKSESGGLR